MAHQFEIAKDVEVEATPEQVWEAIATGPGMDSWFMGRNEIEPREGGSARWSLGDFTMESTVTTWDPPSRFVFRQPDAPDGAFHQFDYRIERGQRGGTRLRFVHTGALSGDDWEAEYEAMGEGDPAYLQKLVQYVTHFSGRFAVPVDVPGPNVPVPDSDHVMATYGRALGLGDDVAVGDKVQVAPAGLAPIDGVVDFVSAHFIGVLTDDAIYRFIHGFEGTTMVGHHLFAEGVDRAAAEAAWRTWLNGLFPSGGDRTAG
jgi:uncharacterized protein YndB with AHSA1/START domain